MNTRPPKTSNPKNVAVIGAGYVGIPTAVTLAVIGHRVALAERDLSRLEMLKSGRSPIHEPGLEPLLQECLRDGSLTCVDNATVAVRGAHVTFLCVPTPQDDDGSADLSYVISTASEIADTLEPGSIVVNKSTVPVGTAQVVERTIGRSDIAVVSNPEFLREGTAVADSFHPDRVVVGSHDVAKGREVSDLFASTGAAVVLTTTATAETIKYASNAFLAVKLSFINAMAGFCESVGADVRDLVVGLGFDPRIGSHYLNVGPGWGGSCLPKDTAALLHMSETNGFDFELLRGAINTNESQLERMVEKISRGAGGLHGKTIGVWGLTFKADTDDRRCSPAVDIVQRLIAAGATVRAYDPMVHEAGSDLTGVEIVRDMYSAVTGADALAVLTEWSEFRLADLRRVAAELGTGTLVDCRNLFEPADVRSYRLHYEGIGSL
ncbi:MAG: UDP-glucose/GDP-mannose dehydrogenase family protein [Acidobacteria bacterium]|nr:UDP-glucose/GDP-mannose dehydrogenase family protein [Acidobacteriota bacterium]